MAYKFKIARDPFSSYSHFIGAILSIIEMVILIITAISHGNSNISIFSVVIFGLSMLALYSASSIYHFASPENPRRVKRLRKLDHSMIYVLIAGTYTPIYLNCVPKPHAYYFMTMMWAIAIVGIIVKMFWMNAPRWISTMFYVLMGWAIIFDIKVLSLIDIKAVILIALGGIAYTIGAVIYIFKKPQITKTIGFHELFHIFIMIGTSFHFLAVWLYII